MIGKGEAGEAREAEAWLASLDGAAESRPLEGIEREPAVAELMERAARCYVFAGWMEEALRLDRALGNRRHEAYLLERQGLWLEAARRYAEIKDWRNGSRCFLAAGEASLAADCMLRDGDTLQAAWTWAHIGRRYARARAVLKDFAPRDRAQTMAMELVLVRCEAGSGSRAGAAKLFDKVLTGLPSLPPHGFMQLSARALQLAEHLGRPDFVASLHAMAVQMGQPAARSAWEKWAREKWNDASGIPIAEQPGHGDEQGQKA